MNFTFRIARRYLFAKKSTNAINLITGISVFGIAVGTAALILVLSVFNGFEDLITSMYSQINPDLKVTPKLGKTFPLDSTTLNQLEQIEGVTYVAQTLEEIAFFQYKDKQGIGALKGVDQNFQEVTKIDSTIRAGIYRFQKGEKPEAVLGLGMHNKLGVNVDDLFSPLRVIMPKESKRTFMGQQQSVKRRLIYPAGVVNVQTDFNNQYILSSLEFARDLFDVGDEVSALEIKLAANASEYQVVKNIESILGEGYHIKNRFQQEEAFLRLMQMEKWLSFAIVSLMMMMVAFNMVGALWMIVLEKKKDVAILKSMGTTDEKIRNIFLNLGLLLTLIGVISGFILAVLLYVFQKSYGLISIPGEFILEAYPISMRLGDFSVVALTVLVIGFLASIAPALRAKRISALIREE